MFKTQPLILLTYEQQATQLFQDTAISTALHMIKYMCQHIKTIARE